MSFPRKRESIDMVTKDEIIAFEKENIPYNLLGERLFDA
jgi:hypothetical protein